MNNPEQNLSTKILSDIIVHMKYAKHLPDKERRETWEEIVDRNKNMHLKRYPELSTEIEEAYQLVYEKKVLPSMRSAQFAGKPIEINPTRLYNCSAVAMDDEAAFSETMFLLLSGSGVGYSVQKHHVNKLPPISSPIRYSDRRKRKKRYLIGDSIEGWADTVKILMKSYFDGNSKEIEFDYRDIRAKGERLITSGGKAPGPQPLKDCVHNVRKVLDKAIEERGEYCKLKPIEVHDIQCYIADAVLAGGIRRSAMISLFSYDDEEMMTCKFGNWWELNPQRGRANNSVVLLRHKIKEDSFFNVWEKVKLSGTGEPGIYFSSDKNLLTNPCAEITLKPMSFCNLTEINVSNIESQEDLNNRARVASFLGTLQAGYTDFHYLREEWREIAEKERLLGVSMTGIAAGEVLKYNLEEAAKEVKKENERISKKLGFGKAFRTTTVKPSGTSSAVLGTSSGIHAWHDQYYIRRVRVGKDEAIYTYLLINHPELIEDEKFNPDKQAVISIPVKAPDEAILRTESPIDLLERVKRVRKEWIEAGHRKGSNYNNVSVTVSIKDDEWDKVGQWMWENRDYYNGISVLPYSDPNYPQLPFESCDKETYETLYKNLKEVDLTKVIEAYDNTHLQGELACSGGNCEIV